MSKLVKNKQVARHVLNENIEAYTEFAHNTVDDKDFTFKVKSQLPFECVVNADMEIPGKTPIRKLGLSAMRMDLADTYTLGVTMTMAHRDVSVFLAVIPSYTQLKEYVKSDQFRAKAKQAFECQIERDN